MSWLGLDYNTGVVLLGVTLLGASAGAVGCFAVLKKRSLTGDALAHAALPGVCIAFLLFHERSLPILVAGAFLSALAGVGVIAGLGHFTRLKQDVAIGFVRGIFYAVGIVLLLAINRLPGGGQAGLSMFIEGKTANMVLTDAYWLGGLAFASLVLVLLFYKEFRLVTFDPDFGRVQGWPMGWLDFGLLLLMVAVVVLGLRAVGVLLMAGLLVIPAASARFWTQRFSRLLMLSAAFGALAGIVGAWFSSTMSRVPAGPSILLTGCALFVMSLIAAPERGLIAMRWRRGALTPPSLD